MTALQAAIDRFSSVTSLTLLPQVPLAQFTRFGIGGPAAIVADTTQTGAFQEALHIVRTLGAPSLVIGGGTNLIVADAGFPGIVLRHTGATIQQNGQRFSVEAGAVLQDVVDRSIAAGLRGIETMTGIPGFLGGGVYGNAGAYGRSLHQTVTRVVATDGQDVFSMSNQDCEFAYRESIFKKRKDLVILSAELQFETGDPSVLAASANKIRTVRDEKYPPAMKCAGSIFKNLLFADLPDHVQAKVPASVVREGKVPSAWFLDQTGVRGMRRGDIQVADYHANLIYNDGAGKAADLVMVIAELKRRVLERFGFEIEEEVQYVGFD